MVDVVTDIIIKSPLKRVADFACNPSNAPYWYVNIKSAEEKSPPPLAAGSLIAFSAQFMGKKFSYTYEVVELSEKKLVMKTAEGPFPMETTYQFEVIDGNTTQMTLRNRGIPSGFSKLFAPFMGMMIRKANLEDLKKIKSILENDH